MLPARPIKILVIGAGGREHAICWKLAQSPHAARIYCAPGNGGTAGEQKTENVDIPASDFAQLADFARLNQIDLVVVGPDNPLAEGIVDYLQERNLPVFGPTREQAKLEWSKAHAKQFLSQVGIPTARFAVCHSLEQAQKAVSQMPWARVVKVDGLALGKGVYVCDSEDEALGALSEIFSAKRFGQAGHAVVLEERLVGEEISLLAFCDGKTLQLMPPCQDHKRRFDGDYGPNTGGMGAYSPVPLYDQCHRSIASEILAPLQKALSSGTLSYKGVLYIGLMVTKESNSAGLDYQPYVLEFNARFGDPETQALLPRLHSDLLPVLWACTQGNLAQVDLRWSEEAACCVVAVCESYPESSSKGELITIGSLPPGTKLFQAGTAWKGGRLETAGGRILATTGLAANLEEAAARAYSGLQNISFAGMAYRTDIARRAAKQCLSS